MLKWEYKRIVAKYVRLSRLPASIRDYLFTVKLRALPFDVFSDARFYKFTALP